MINWKKKKSKSKQSKVLSSVLIPKHYFYYHELHEYLMTSHWSLLDGLLYCYNFVDVLYKSNRRILRPFVSCNNLKVNRRWKLYYYYYCFFFQFGPKLNHKNLFERQLLHCARLLNAKKKEKGRKRRFHHVFTCNAIFGGGGGGAADSLMSLSGILLVTMKMYSWWDHTQVGNSVTFCLAYICIRHCFCTKKNNK